MHPHDFLPLCEQLHMLQYDFSDLLIQALCKNATGLGGLGA